jgi:sortase (surface protein transpeptidase)
MTEAQRQGGTAGADGDGAVHPARPAGEAPPGEPAPGSDSDLAGGGDRAAGLSPAVPQDGLAAGGAQAVASTAAASTAVAVAEAPPSTATTVVPAVQPAPAGPAPASAGPPAGSSGMRRPVLRITAMAMLLLAGVLLGYVVYLYGLSDVQEARSQSLLYSQFQLELANQVAPLGPNGPNGLDGAAGPTIPGSPVAILNIPSIGIRDLVVVQGTTPQNLMVGPGHRPDSPLPGQPGVVQIYGRRATFGAPFSRLGELRPGDIITAITGQGSSTYAVAAAAPSSMIIKDPSPGRMVLLTAYSPTVPTYYYQVDADLISTVKPSPGVAPAVYSTELPLANDTSTLAMTMVWSIALVLVAAIGTVAAIRWSRWAAYLAGVPLAMAVLWNLYESLAALLPNLY